MRKRSKPEASKRSRERIASDTSQPSRVDLKPAVRHRLIGLTFKVFFVVDSPLSASDAWDQCRRKLDKALSSLEGSFEVRIGEDFDFVELGGQPEP